MCMICDGATVEEYSEHLHENIAGYGFTMVGVEHGARGYVYTVGLLDRLDHPELLAAHAELPVAARVVDQLAQGVLVGARLDAADEATVFGTPVGIRPVAEAQLHRGLVAAWDDYYRAYGRPDLQPVVLQVVLPDRQRCFEHQTTQPRLDRAAPTLLSDSARSRARARHGRYRRR